MSGVLCHLNMVEMFVFVDFFIQDGWSALMLASENGHRETTELLLQHLAQVNMQNKVTGHNVLTSGSC